MSSTLPLIIMDQACGDAISWVIQELTGNGLQTLRTFDIKTAQHVNSGCPCPHHGTDPCDCQMIVLLVYQGSRPPVSLVAHGYNERTWLYLVDAPGQRADPHLEAAIRQALIRSPLLKLPEQHSHTV
jgi:hypothetical protein